MSHSIDNLRLKFFLYNKFFILCPVKQNSGICFLFRLNIIDFGVINFQNLNARKICVYEEMLLIIKM